jgi:hypothetical protein
MSPGVRRSQLGFAGACALAAACADPDVDTGAAPVVTPWTYTSADAPAPLLTVESVGPGLTVTLEEVAGMDPLLAFDAYDHVMAQADTDCPQTDDSYGFQDYWEDDCTSAAGARFLGWALSERAENVPIGGEQCADNGFYFGVAAVEGGDGYRWDGWGQLSWNECYDPGARSTRLDAGYRGNFGFDGGGDTWLAEALSTNLDVHATITAEGRTVSLSGGLSGLAGDVQAVWFDDVTLGDAAATGACSREPTGRMLAWDRAGVAYTVTFDAGVTDADAACDGCGALTIAGAAAGEACVDVAPLLGWEDRPWG